MDKAPSLGMEGQLSRPPVNLENDQYKIMNMIKKLSSFESLTSSNPNNQLQPNNQNPNQDSPSPDDKSLTAPNQLDVSVSCKDLMLF
jgi:hypothetical protein